MLVRFTTLVSLGLLSACGGGGGSTPPPAPTVAITADNAIAVAAAVYNANFDLVQVARVAGSFFDLEPPADPPPGPTIAQTIPGPEGGEAQFLWQDFDGNRFVSSGDVLTLNLTAYADAGITLDGSVVFDDIALQGAIVRRVGEGTQTGISWILDARMQLLDVTLTKAGVETTLDGELPFYRERRPTVDLLAVEIAAEFQVGASRLQVGNSIGRNVSQIVPLSWLEAEGALDAPDLGGRLLFTTPEVLTGFPVLPDPTGGRLVIRGAGRSTVTIAPIDISNLELLVDADGDGEDETTLSIEWSQLQPQPGR